MFEHSRRNWLAPASQGRKLLSAVACAAVLWSANSPHAVRAADQAVQGPHTGMGVSGGLSGNVSAPDVEEWTDGAPGVPVLYLFGGDWMAGAPAAADRAGVLNWQSPDFLKPFEFDMAALKEVRFPPQPLERQVSGYRLELSGGDVLYGELVSLSAEELEFEARHAGRLRLRRSLVRQLERCRDNAGLIYVGPQGWTGWKSPPGRDQWRDEDGHLVSTHPSDVLYGDFALPAQARIEFELSWTVSPDFVLALAAGEDTAGVGRAFRFETVDHQLVVVHETGDDIDVAAVAALDQGPGRVALEVYLDQTRQQADVFSQDGEPLASVRTEGPGAAPLPGIYLEHKRGGLRLERLRIARWNGASAERVVADKPRIHCSDGTILYGDVRRFDPAAGRFRLSGGDGEQDCDARDVDRIVLEKPEPCESAPIRFTYADGTCFGTRRLTGGSDERIAVECREGVVSASGSLDLPFAGLSGIRFDVPRPEADAEAPPNQPRALLHLRSMFSHGQLVPSTADENQTCLVWQPAGSSTASALVDDASARIVFSRAVGRKRVKAGGEFRDIVYLLGGDVFSCGVKQIDSAGVSFASALGVEGNVAFDKVKALELGGHTPAILAADKRQRLLTLPRLQKHDPPPHILCSKHDDYLRGRLLAMSDDYVRFEAGGVERRISRERVACIVWLHPEGLAGSDNEALRYPARRVQARCIDGTRITFTAQQVDGESISGMSDEVGSYRLALAQLSELLIGARVQQAAAGSPYESWQLTDAEEPLAFKAEREGVALSAGADSPLVGQGAPDFELPLVGGSTFRLSQHKGKTVVLDFWATWCGPCVQSLPRLAETVAACPPGDVKLVTVNLQETASTVSDALARMKLDVTVALDRDGSVAGRYGATAIPYTVIVAPDGRVARVFVGGGPHTAEQLQVALKELTVAGPKSDAQPAE